MDLPTRVPTNFLSLPRDPRNWNKPKDLEGKMRSSSQWLQREIAVLLALVLTISTGEGGTALAQQASQGANASNASAVSETALPDNPAPATSQSSDQAQQAAGQQPGSVEPQTDARKPVGTAAAPYERTMGVAASRPAGAAIAPAKQRRVRTIFISVGIIVGAGIAVGSVAALSHGSPSRP